MGTLGVATLTTEVDLRGLQKGLAQGEKATTAITKRIGQAADLAFAGALAGATAFVADSISEFQTFEKGMSEVFTLMPNMTAEAMGQMEQDVLTFGQAVGRTSDETIPALYQSISAGVPAANVFDFMQVASDAALGGVTTLETAVDGISSAVNAYGSEALSAQQASDLMFTAVKGGKTTFGDLAGSLFNVIPTAASLGVEFGNITAALAAMTAQGTPTTVATTQLRQLLIELSKDGSKTADTFERIAGKSFVDFIASGGNLQGALQLLEGAAADSGLRLSDMFGSVEAGAAALTLTGTGTEKFTAELDAAASAAGATATAAETMGETGAQAVARLTASFEALKIMVGEEVAPTVADFAEKAVKQLGLMTSSLEQKKLVTDLKKLGLSFSDVNDVIGDGRAQLDLWRTAADMERDTTATAEGVRRLEYALVAVNLGLENNLQVTSGLGGVYTTGRDAVTEFVEAMEQFDLALPVVTTGMEYWTLATEQVTTATVEAADAVEVATVDTSLLTIDVIQATNAIEGMTVSQEASEEATRAQAEATAAHRDILLGFWAESAGAVEPLFAAYALAEEATGRMIQVDGQWMTDHDAAATAIQLANSNIATSYRQTAADAILAEQGINQATLDLMVTMGLLTQAEADQRLEFASNSDIILNTLVPAFNSGRLTASEMEIAIGLLEDGTVNSGEAAINWAEAANTQMTPAMNDAKLAAIALETPLRTIKDAAEDVAGNYSINFDITQTGSIPNVNGGYAGSSGAGNVAPDDSFAFGGYTGRGRRNEIAGFVHANEYVLPADAVQDLGLPFLESLRRGNKRPMDKFDYGAIDPVIRPQIQGGAGGGNTTFHFDLRGSVISSQAQMEQWIDAALLKKGVQADTYIRTR